MDTKYNIKNVKTFIGREGHGYSCTLYKRSKRLAAVLDPADGSEPTFIWSGQQEKDEFAQYVATLDPAEYYAEFTPSFSPKRVSASCVVATLVDNWCFNKRNKIEAKTKTLFRCAGDPVGVWRVLHISWAKLGMPGIERYAKEKGLHIEAVFNAEIDRKNA